MDNRLETVAVYKDGARLIVNKRDVDEWIEKGWKLEADVESAEEVAPAEEEPAAPRRRRRTPKLDNPFGI